MDPNAASPAQSQSQSQSQEQNVIVTVDSSGDPLLEHRIFATVQSAGRQLGYLSAVVQVLLDAHEGDPRLTAHPGAAAAIDDFRRAQADIERIKQLREPERILEELRSDKGARPEHARELRDKLRAWLAQFDVPKK
jgi:hypothetical protein